MECKNCEHYNICVVCNYIHDKCGYYEPIRSHDIIIPVATIEVDEEKIIEIMNKAVERARQHGEWVEKGHYTYCSECGEECATLYSFCPYCGADMRKEGDEEWK